MAYLSGIKKNRVSQNSWILVPLLFLVFGCGEELLSPQTNQECIDKAIFGVPAESPYCLPYAVDSSYLLTQSYCSAVGRSHERRFAYDFKMPFGTEILAARAGTVVEFREHYSDDDPTGGHENMVCLEHEDGRLSLYIHMKQEGVEVELGDYVPKGGRLGWIGTSGTGFSHLHFQVCEGAGKCTYPDQEFTMPVNFSSIEGILDSRGGLVEGKYYKAKPCE